MLVELNALGVDKINFTVKKVAAERNSSLLVFCYSQHLCFILNNKNFFCKMTESEVDSAGRLKVILFTLYFIIARFRVIVNARTHVFAFNCYFLAIAKRVGN